ncbi:hypothetical protein Tco_1390823 [Tanacetum coccineum]
MGKRVPDKNRCITVNLFHDGVFIVHPFEYVVSDVKQITNIQFEGMSFVQFRENDSNVDQFVNFAYQNKWKLNLYVEHSGYDALDIKDQGEHSRYDALDIRDQGETMADDGNESSDVYCSSNEEDLSYVDFHTELDDIVVINIVTTNDPFLNKLCGDSVDFINLVREPVNENVETVVEDTENIDHVFNVKEGISYLTHDPNQDWKKMEPILGMRFHHPEQLKLCLANYGVANRCVGADSLKKEKERVG